MQISRCRQDKTKQWCMIISKETFIISTTDFVYACRRIVDRKFDFGCSYNYDCKLVK